MTLRKVERGTEPLRGLIALAGPSNSGKTFSALRIAAGLVEVLGGKVALLDTELRGNLYHHRFAYDHFILDPPFNPKAWMEAFRDLDGQYSVIISDNFSDEYEGPGGVAEMAALSTLRNDIAKWAEPKAQHKALMSKIRLLKSQHIFLLRASDKIEISQDRDEEGRPVGKQTVRPLGWQPHAEKNFKYDITIGWMLPPECVGHANLWKTIDGFDFQDGEQLSEDHGRRIAAWIKGEAVPPAAPPQPRLPDVLTIRGVVGEILYQGKDHGEAFLRYHAAAKDMAGDVNAIAEFRVQNYQALEAMFAAAGPKRAGYLKGEIEGVR